MVKPWGRLDEVVAPGPVPLFIWAFGGIVGLLIPLEIVCFGWILQLLSIDNADSLRSLELGEWIRIPGSLFYGEGNRLRGVTTLLGSAFLIAIAYVFFQWIVERIAASIGNQRSQVLSRAIFIKSGQLAAIQSISGQRTTLREAMEESTPKVRAAWEAWYRMVPRYGVQAVACFVLALCIHPLVTLLSVVCVALLSQLYRMLDLKDRTSHPVLNERISSLKLRIKELCETGPLLAFVHAEEASAESLNVQLRSLMQAEEQLQTSRGWKKPTMALFVVMAICFVGFILSVRMVQPNSDLHISSTFMFFSAVIGATAACLGLQSVGSYFREGNDKAQSLVTLLTQHEDETPLAGKQSIKSIANRIELDHVTLRDSLGHKLLEDVCMTMEPGKLVAVIGSDRLQARALAEMLLGFGRPSSGRILLDSVNMIDIDPIALRKNSAWIGPDGPLVAGTLEDNLHNERTASLVELTEAVRAAGVYEAIQNLSDGLTTMVSPHDDRLKPDYLFRLGIARAIAKKPSLVVAEEPDVRVTPTTEEETLQSLRQLTSRGMFVLVLPNRLMTLRQADTIVVLHEHQVAAIGNHSQLLESSELYRHLNYIRFSPLRHILA